LPGWRAAEPQERLSGLTVRQSLTAVGSGGAGGTVEQVRHRATKGFLLSVLGKESKKMASKHDAQFLEINIANDETALFE
jgi:hypothetical protein